MAVAARGLNRQNPAMSAQPRGALSNWQPATTYGIGAEARGKLRLLKARLAKQYAVLDADA